MRNQALGSPTRNPTQVRNAGMPASATTAAAIGGTTLAGAASRRIRRTSSTAATARATAAAAPVGRVSAAARPSRPAAHHTRRCAATSMPATRARNRASEYAIEKTTDSGAEQQIATRAQPVRLP